MPSEAQMHAAVHEYIRALNESDLEAIVALYAEDAVVEDPVGSPARRGHAAIRDFYASSLALGLSVRLEGPVRAMADEAVFPFSVSFVYQGHAMRIEPIDHFSFDAQGRIRAMRAFFGASNRRAG